MGYEANMGYEASVLTIVVALIVIASHCHWLIDYTVYLVSISISISTYPLLV